MTGLERRLAADDVGVPGRRIGALLGDLPVVLRLGDGERPPPLGLLALVLGLGGLEPGPRLVHPGLARAGAEETAEAGRRDGREVVPVRCGERGPERAGIESGFPRSGQQPFERQRAERQDAGQHLAKRLHPLLDLSGLLLGRPLPLRQVFLLAEPFGVFLALPALARQPVFVAPLRGEALLPRRKAPDPGHGSPGLRTDSYGMTITRGQGLEKILVTGGPVNWRDRARRITLPRTGVVSGTAARAG
jgi:hypothetical protein